VEKLKGRVAPKGRNKGVGGPTQRIWFFTGTVKEEGGSLEERGGGETNIPGFHKREKKKWQSRGELKPKHQDGKGLGAGKKERNS